MDKNVCCLLLISMFVLSGCIVSDSVTFHMKISYKNNWNKPVDIVTKWRTRCDNGYEMKSILVGEKASGFNISGILNTYHDKINVTVSIYEINSPTDENGYKIDSYALNIEEYSLNLNSEDNTIYIAIVIDSDGNIIMQDNR